MTGVTGFSRLDYVLSIAEDCYKRSKEGVTKISPADINAIVLKTAHRIEERWLREVGKRGGMKAGLVIANKCLEALKKWNLISREYTINQKIINIGRSLVKDKNKKLAKQELLDAVLSSRREKPFHPSQLWMSIRDSKPSFVKTTFRIRGKKGNIGGPAIQLKEEDGIAYDDETFVKKVGTNFLALDIMRDWGEFFEILNYYPLYTEKIQNEVKSWINDYKKSVGYNPKLRWPRYGIYLTIMLASAEELMRILTLLRSEQRLTYPQLIDALNLNTYACKCLIEILYKMDLISVTESKIALKVEKETSFEEILEVGKEKSVIISDGPEVYGIVTDKFNQLWHQLKPEKTYFVMKQEVPLEDFKRSLTKNYAEMVKDRYGIPVWISELAYLVCKELRIPRKFYDDLIVKLYEMNYVNLFRSTTHLAGIKFYARRPLYYYDTAYYLMSIG